MRIAFVSQPWNDVVPPVQLDEEPTANEWMTAPVA